MSEPLGKLVHRLDRELAKHKKGDVTIWVTFLSDDPTRTDPMVVDWSKQHATGSIPLGVYNDTVGPPTYLLAKDADVTVLLNSKQKVVANFAFRQGELNEPATERILKAVPNIIPKTK